MSSKAFGGYVDVMDQERLKELLQKFKGGEIELEQALDGLRHLPFESLGYATVDHHRTIRQGFPEVIFGQGKTPEQVAGIGERLLARSSNLLVTRTNPEAFKQVKQIAADAVFHESCNAISVQRD
ncbi:MAG: nickel pincer cofactor biosynthesis protein LarB, partial [Blastocatellia bacterium]